MTSNQPLSPWAARHGIVGPASDAVFRREGIQHSGIAPEPRDSPWLDPIFYSDKPRTSDAGTFLNFNEIDRLFFSEILQGGTELYMGIKSWQIGVTHKTLKFSDRVAIPGGHQEASPSAFKGDPETHPGWESKRLYDDGLIKPNEESWFPFLRKDRWLNWSNNAAVLDGEPWSVDNPQVWEVLSISLELANRVLRALAYDMHPFLIDLLFGYMGPWSAVAGLLSPDLNLPPPKPNSLVLISYGYYSQYRDTCDKGVSDYMEQLPLLGERNLTEKLEKLLAEQMWSFDDREGALGTTWAHLDSVISIQVSILTQLMEGNITLAERCLLQFKLAVVILHEMGHAISGNRINEMFFDFGGAAEVGHELDMALWGGVFELGRLLSMTQPPCGFISQNWPISDSGRTQRRGVFIDGHHDFAAGRLIEKELIPAEFTSKLLSESFWNDPESPSKKTGNFFHRTRLFTSRTPLDPSKPYIINPVIIDQSLDLDQLTRTEKLMVQDWKEREALWDTVRAGWFQENHNLWIRTPWGSTTHRWMITSFAEAHKKGDIETSTQIADNLTDVVPWSPSTTREEYIRHLEASDNRWIMHVIGLLMMASIPIRREGQLSPYAKNPYGPEHWVPSKEAEKSGRSALELTLDEPSGGRPLSASRFVNPLSTGEATGEMEGTHFHFLHMVGEVLWYLARAQRRVPAPWIREITRVEGILGPELRDRSKTALFSYEMNDAWTRSWYFEIPEYNPNEMFMWIDDKWTVVQ
ncbi:hypothetical protein FHL15_000130 [Xylaria flabelliformis]|uniref:Uncharacterized protein n=1 Tax=Xylaria flabelliformis TaxID=2512241 RepID=A0A553IF01_9PEZI|nr:hypothetical protein FHL15_000130 [Xylaria flabelliformis]